MFAQVVAFVRARTKRTKKCSSCGKMLPMSEFNKNRTKLDGKQTLCKKCQMTYYKKVVKRAKTKRKRAAKRQKPTNVSELTIKCSRCGRRKPPNEFHVRQASPNGRQAWCKKCLRSYVDSYTRKAAAR